MLSLVISDFLSAGDSESAASKATGKAWFAILKDNR